MVIAGKNKNDRVYAKGNICIVLNKMQCYQIKMSKCFYKRQVFIMYVITWIRKETTYNGQ